MAGHDFSRADKPSKNRRAIAPAVIVFCDLSFVNAILQVAPGYRFSGTAVDLESVAYK